MSKRTTVLAGALGVLALGVAGRRYLQDRSTPQVDYETVENVGDVEIRHYPPTVLVETVASSENAAFRRLFRYISGENRSATDVSMTAPVESGGKTPGQSVAMTAPVESDRDGDGVRMAFYLPPEYDYDTAPRPTDESVRLIEQPGRTLAVLGFSWWTSDGRVARKTDQLRSTLAEANGTFELVGEPFLMRYEGPLVPPFLRTNEVAVEVRRVSAP